MTSANVRTRALSDIGVSIWLDYLSRSMLESGKLSELVDTHNVVGVTTNPTIFADALKEGSAYDAQIRELMELGADVDEAVFTITTDDIRHACELMRPVYDATNGEDGQISIEVDPRLARDTERTVEMARRLWRTIDCPNVMIKIPATAEGLPAISTVLAEGINVNVTLVFGLDRYRGVMNAVIAGLEQARQAGRDLSTIRSVASFFVSRVDSEIDTRLDAIGSPEAAALKGKAGVANARLAYQAFDEVFSTSRWQTLADDGAHVQRPLWASTGVKNPDYADTMYVVDLAVDRTVNTMPPKTLKAFADHGALDGDQVTGRYDEARQVLDDLERIGVSYRDVVNVLEDEGVDKFGASWDVVLTTVREALTGVGSAAPGGA